jgi:hypothetical protein
MTKTSRRPILKLKFSNLTSLPKQAEVTAIATKTPKLLLEPSPKKLLMEAEEYLNLLNQLKIKYPKAFPEKGKQIVILALGIHKELAKALDISIKKARIFCRLYCSRKIYVTARIPGAKRYDLEGNITGEITTIL